MYHASAAFVYEVPRVAVPVKATPPLWEKTFAFRIRERVFLQVE